MRSIIIVLLVLSIQGCASDFFEIKYAPISKSDDAYSLIGKECELIDSWHLIGWENFDNNGVIDSYDLQRIDNVGSRHIVDQIKLRKMTKIRIVSIERNTSWKLFDDNYKFNIEITGLPVKAHKTEHVERIEVSNYDVCLS